MRWVFLLSFVLVAARCPAAETSAEAYVGARSGATARLAAERGRADCRSEPNWARSLSVGYDSRGGISVSRAQAVRVGGRVIGTAFSIAIDPDRTSAGRVAAEVADLGELRVGSSAAPGHAHAAARGASAGFLARAWAE